MGDEVTTSVVFSWQGTNEFNQGFIAAEVAANTKDYLNCPYSNTLAIAAWNSGYNCALLYLIWGLTP